MNYYCESQISIYDYFYFDSRMYDVWEIDREATRIGELLYL